jgi:hypothetical protein
MSKNSPPPLALGSRPVGRGWGAIGVAMTVVGGGAVFGAAQTKHTGPILAFVGALMVALLTVYTADRHQREQLAHDRKLHDLGSLRQLLVRTSSLMYGQTRPLAAILSFAGTHQGALSSQDHDRIMEAVRELQSQNHEISELSGELLLYFDENDPIYVAFRNFNRAVGEGIMCVLQPRMQTAEELNECLSPVAERTGQASRHFRSASRVEISYREPGEPAAHTGRR